jgi:hypothetical protein
MPVMLSAYEAEEARKKEASELACNAKAEADRRAELYRDIHALCQRALAPKN